MNIVGTHDKLQYVRKILSKSMEIKKANGRVLLHAGKGEERLVNYPREDVRPKKRDFSPCRILLASPAGPRPRFREMPVCASLRVRRRSAVD